MDISLIMLALAGLCISLFFLIEDFKLAQPSKNKIIAKVCNAETCSSILGSPYATVFGIRNYLIGLTFYSTIIIFEYTSITRNFTATLLLFSFLSSLFSTYLAYTLIFKLKKNCVLCFISHAINFFIFAYFAKFYIGF